MRINGIPVTVDMTAMGFNLVLVTPRPAKSPEDKEKIKALTEHLCGRSGGRLVNEEEIMNHPEISKNAILFTGDAWKYSVPFYNKITN